VYELFFFRQFILIIWFFDFFDLLDALCRYAAIVSPMYQDPIILDDGLRRRQSIGDCPTGSSSRVMSSRGLLKSVKRQTDTILFRMKITRNYVIIRFEKDQTCKITLYNSSRVVHKMYTWRGHVVNLRFSIKHNINWTRNWIRVSKRSS